MQAINLSGKRQGSIQTIFNLWFQSEGKNFNSNKLYNTVAILRYISRKINNHTIHETDNDSFNKLKFSIFSFYHHSEYFGYCWFEHAWFSSHRILLLIVACLQILCSSIDRVFSQKTGIFEAQNYKELRLFLLLDLWPIFNTLSSFM